MPASRERDVPADLAGLLDELFARTHKRVYLAAAQSGQVVIPLARGRQGMPRIPGLGARIGENAHALALGKVALSLLDERRLERYLGHGLRGFTPHTITSPDALREQLAEIRAGAVAFDCEEFTEDFCCLAMPVRNASGRASRRSASRCRRAASSSSASRSRRRCATSPAQAAQVLAAPQFQRFRKTHEFLSSAAVRP